jgi:hypothetical protein
MEIRWSTWEKKRKFPAALNFFEKVARRNQWAARNSNRRQNFQNNNNKKKEIFNEEEINWREILARRGCV